MPFDGTSPNMHPDIEGLLAARARLAWNGGWTQHAFARGFGVCASQAIATYCGHDRAHCARLVAQELPWPYRLLVFSSRAQLILFNDRSTTTQAMVVHLFDRAIAKRQHTIEMEQLCLT